MAIVDVPIEDLSALRDDEPVVKAAREWFPEIGRARADRLEELIRLAHLAGLHQFRSVTFHTIGGHPDLPIADIRGYRITFARPRTCTGLAVMVPCDAGCGAEVARIFRGRRGLEREVAFGYAHCPRSAR